MNDHTEICERLARVEQHLIDLNGWQEKSVKGLQKVDKRTWELKEEFALWRGKESRAVKIISVITATVTSVVLILAGWLWRARN